MSETPSSFDLEKARLALDREKWEAENAIRREELALRRAELDRSRWVNPLVIAIFAATAAALGNAGITLINSIQQLKLEQERAHITQSLNAEQSRASLSLEQSKAEAARILEVVKTNDPDKAAANLKFLVDTGLIADQNVRQQLQTYLDRRKPGEGVVLPTPQALPASISPLRSISCSFPASYGMEKVKGALIAVLALPPLALSPMWPSLEKGTWLNFEGPISTILPGHEGVTDAAVDIVGDGDLITANASVSIILPSISSGLFNQTSNSQIAAYLSAVVKHLNAHLAPFNGKCARTAPS